MTRKYNRRTFLDFLGKGTIGVVVAPSIISACATSEGDDPEAGEVAPKPGFPFTPIDPTEIDELVLADGFSYDVLVKWGDPISANDKFGFNNDFTQFIPVNGDEDGLLWVNHEYVDPKFTSRYGLPADAERTIEQVHAEMYEIGGSIVRIKKKGKGWKMVENDPYNRRITGKTEIPFNWTEPIAGKEAAMGMVFNCSGGVTPWGTILTCEENYDSFYGESVYGEGNYGIDEPQHQDGSYGWETYYPENKPEHYGWVVEVDVKTGDIKKHVALGRWNHECATMKELEDGRVVVYSGDDSIDRCLYKYVSANPGDLQDGVLYVANIEAGRWEPMDLELSPILQEKYKSQTEVMVRAREAAYDLEGTKLARPEDIEIDPVTGAVLVALTNDTTKENFFGEILKVEELEGYDGLTFQAETYLAGGEEMGFACPDNMAFDPRGNLWFTSDMSGKVMNLDPYTPFKNNGLFFVPRDGERAGEVLQVASAPIHAEFTGPSFSPDGKTLFLSVQHPGEYSETAEDPASHWPEGGDAMPKPSVVTIQGKALDAIMKGHLGEKMED